MWSWAADLLIELIDFVIGHEMFLVDHCSWGCWFDSFDRWIEKRSPIAPPVLLVLSFLALIAEFLVSQFLVKNTIVLFVGRWAWLSSLVELFLDLRARNSFTLSNPWSKCPLLHEPIVRIVLDVRSTFKKMRILAKCVVYQHLYLFIIQTGLSRWCNCHSFLLFDRYLICLFSQLSQIVITSFTILLDLFGTFVLF